MSRPSTRSSGRPRNTLTQEEVGLCRKAFNLFDKDGA